MNVVIFSGGSGSDSLQRGLYETYPELNIQVITNAYDNGLSTGLIRTVFDGKILGPSDVRKNQSRHYSLVHGKNDVYDFIEHRFTSNNPQEYVQQYFESKEWSPVLSVLNDTVQDYFESIPNALDIEYVDFSIGNIIYGYLAHQFDNSLQAAADYMRELLDIPQETILNSDESLFLQAITESGKILHDEVDIVEYAAFDDPIVDIRFMTCDGEYKEESFFCQRAIDAVQTADMIIFSTGTQWSSLIPTYKCEVESGESLFSIIKNSKAKQFFLVNGTQDKDMYGANGDDIISLLSNYLPVTNMNIISGDTEMKPVNYDCFIEDFGGDKYNPAKLANFIVWTYFDQPKSSDMFVFDWDDTLVGRKGSYAEESKQTVSMLPSGSMIISGNTHNKIKLLGKVIYADGGVNKYCNGQHLECLDTKTRVTETMYEKIKQFILKHGFNMSMLQNRGGVCLSIKPLNPQYRSVVKELLTSLVDDNFEVECTGQTTIDIKHKDNNKLKAMRDIIKQYPDRQIFYVGDELESGNDSIINENKVSLGVSVVSVRCPVDTLSFLKCIR